MGAVFFLAIRQQLKNNHIYVIINYVEDTLNLKLIKQRIGVQERDLMIIRIVKLVNGRTQWADTVGPAGTDEEASASLRQARQMLKFAGIGYLEGGWGLLGGDSQYDTWKAFPNGSEFRIQKVRFIENGVEVLCDYART